MQVFVIQSTNLGAYPDNDWNVEAVRLTMAKAEAYIRSCGKLLQWEVQNRPGNSLVARACVLVDGSEYWFLVNTHETE